MACPLEGLVRTVWLASKFHRVFPIACLDDGQCVQIEAIEGPQGYFPLNKIDPPFLALYKLQEASPYPPRRRVAIEIS